jgi:hypothetical protein
MEEVFGLLQVGDWEQAKELLARAGDPDSLGPEIKTRFAESLNECMFVLLEMEEIQMAFEIYRTYADRYKLEDAVSRAFIHLMKSAHSFYEDGQPKIENQMIALKISVLFAPVINFDFLYAEYIRWVTSHILGSLMRDTPLGQYHRKALIEGARAEIRALEREAETMKGGSLPDILRSLGSRPRDEDGG